MIVAVSQSYLERQHTIADTLRGTHVIIQVRKPVVVRCTKTPEAPRDEGARGDESTGGDEACVPVDRQKDAPGDDCAARNDSRCLGVQDR
jgi:hypothetical protein